jgi:nucleoside-diphosphate kinase
MENKMNPWFKVQVVRCIPGNITCGIIKPDAYDDHKSIIDMIEYDYKFYVSNIVPRIFTEDDVRALYYRHINKDFFERNKEFLMNGPSLCMAISGQDALKIWRCDIMPRIRGDVSTLKDHEKHLTKVHGSDSEENAFRELQYFFG